MAKNNAGRSCGLQVIPAYRLLNLQARLVGVDSIHKRIKKLRELKGLSQEALAELVGIKYQSVQEWEREGGTAPSRKRQEKVAKALGVSVAELISGTPAAREPDAAYHVEAVARDGKEEILLHLYRGLFSLQQERLMASLRALFHANQVTRKELGQKPLKGVSDEQVRDAFGDAPFHRIKRLERKKLPPRQPGSAMDDFLED
jgi:transcriptional regulator with XRE-family HTH domain